MALPQALQGDSWTKETARAALPILIWCAKNGRTITYGRLDKEIVKRIPLYTSHRMTALS